MLVVYLILGNATRGRNAGKCCVADTDLSLDRRTIVSTST